MVPPELYSHRLVSGGGFAHAPTKAVCVGQNYAAHARELGNTVPDEPLLFIKPLTAMRGFGETLSLATRFGSHHYETEMTLLIGDALCRATPHEARAAVAGVGVGLDLTRRELQTELRGRGHPWERCKGFDGACVLSPFAPCDQSLDLQDRRLRLWRNGELVQDGHTADMVFSAAALLADISHTFTLLPGDVVMTGTPEGVGPLAPGDWLEASLEGLVWASTRVVAQEDP
ncbi:MAG: fumarylacetoacetate hydrolase family protein [Gammaproteobacteria bacterium]|nr:fumarylacetoacetate hydrolase family protein [Gammaproteobacteria bacterium]NIY33139.1 fumarylacetoacetate hydrolase family protein [Gammaproteobacteria bacterium]